MEKKITFPIVEIFQSLQGEGFNTGKQATFIRFGRCNLNCPWCDTNFRDFERWDMNTILKKVSSFVNHFIVITGGEPTVQKHLEEFVNKIKEVYPSAIVAIETNGILNPPENIDYIATSPKRIYAKAYTKRHLNYANEVRIVVDAAEAEMIPFIEFVEREIPAKRFFLSPCEIDGKFNIQETISLLGTLNSRKNDCKSWLLSIQTHKLIGMR